MILYGARPSLPRAAQHSCKMVRDEGNPVLAGNVCKFVSEKFVCRSVWAELWQLGAFLARQCQYWRIGTRGFGTARRLVVISGDRVLRPNELIQVDYIYMYRHLTGYERGRNGRCVLRHDR